MSQGKSSADQAAAALGNIIASGFADPKVRTSQCRAHIQPVVFEAFLFVSSSGASLAAVFALQGGDGEFQLGATEAGRQRWVRCCSGAASAAAASFQAGRVVRAEHSAFLSLTRCQRSRFFRRGTGVSSRAFGSLVLKPTFEITWNDVVEVRRGQPARPLAMPRGDQASLRAVLPQPSCGQPPKAALHGAWKPFLPISLSSSSASRAALA